MDHESEHTHMYLLIRFVHSKMWQNGAIIKDLNGRLSQMFSSSKLNDSFGIWFKTKEKKMFILTWFFLYCSFRHHFCFVVFPRKQWRQFIQHCRTEHVLYFLTSPAMSANEMCGTANRRWHCSEFEMGATTPWVKHAILIWNVNKLQETLKERKVLLV